MASIPGLAIPGYSQAPDINWTSLSDLGKTLGENRLNNQRREAMSLATLGQDGTPDYKRTINSLVSLGDLAGAGQVAAIQKSIAPESSADMQAYSLYKKQGGALPFLDFKKQLAEAGSTKINNTTNVNNVGEKEYDKAMGKELADLNVGIIKGANSARSNLSNIDRLEAMLNEPGVYQGTEGGKVLAAKRLAQSLGINVGEGVGPAETAQAISNQLALQARNPAGGAGMPGAMSDSDREFLKNMQPGLEKTPEGNRLIIDTTRKLNQRAVDVEKFRQDYLRRNGRLNEGFYTALSNWSEKNPLFPQATDKGGASAQQAAPRRARMAPQDVDTSLSNARASIARNPGARDAIIQRLRENGIDPSGL